MGKIMEVLFCVFYLIFTPIIGCKILKNSKGNKQVYFYGIMTLTLVGGDAFHLVPRIIAAINSAGDYRVALGIGKMITSITMTIFYCLLYCIYEMRYNKKNIILRRIIGLLAVTRIILCVLPQNEWTGASPIEWGVYRNIPFVILGLIIVILFFKERSDQYFKWMWLAITFSFAFYIPVVLWADAIPIIGMLMLPKTCMYIWIVMMGYKLEKYV